MPLAFQNTARSNIIHQRSESCIFLGGNKSAWSVTKIEFRPYVPFKLKILNEYLDKHINTNPKTKAVSQKTFSKFNNFIAIKPILRNSELEQTDKYRRKDHKIFPTAGRSLKKFPPRKILTAQTQRARKTPEQESRFSFPHPEQQIFRNKEIMKRFNSPLEHTTLIQSRRSLSAKGTTHSRMSSYQKIENRKSTLLSINQTIRVSHQQ